MCHFRITISAHVACIELSSRHHQGQQKFRRHVLWLSWCNIRKCFPVLRHLNEIKAPVSTSILATSVQFLHRHRRKRLLKELTFYLVDLLLSCSVTSYCHGCPWPRYLGVTESESVSVRLVYLAISIDSCVRETLLWQWPTCYTDFPMTSPSQDPPAKLVALTSPCHMTWLKREFNQFCWGQSDMHAFISASWSVATWHTSSDAYISVASPFLLPDVVTTFFSLTFCML